MIPEDRTQRRMQVSGGFVAKIDFSKTIEKAVKKLGLNASLIISDATVLTGGRDRVVYSSQLPEAEKEKRYFSKYISSYSSTSKVPASGSQLELKLKSPDGITKQVIEKILLVDFIVFILSVPVGILIYFLLKGLRQRKEVESRLASATAQAFKTLHSIDDTVVTLDHDGFITSTNASADQFLGNVNGSLLKHVLKMEEKDSITGRMRPIDVSDLLTEKNKGHRLSNIYFSNSRHEEYIVDVNVNTLNELSTGKTTGYVVVIRDVSEVYKMAEEIEFRISHDALTKLPNRYKFESALTRSIEKALSSGNELALIYIDLDQFKLINDACGHGAGDSLLIKISEELLEYVGENDLLARLGGDEFGILVNDKDYAEAIEYAQSIKRYFQECYFTQDDNSFAIRASLGFVYIDEQFQNLEDVMSAADIACYTLSIRIMKFSLE